MNRIYLEDIKIDDHIKIVYRDKWAIIKVVDKNQAQGYICGPTIKISDAASAYMWNPNNWFSPGKPRCYNRISYRFEKLDDVDIIAEFL